MVSSLAAKPCLHGADPGVDRLCVVGVVQACKYVSGEQIFTLIEAEEAGKAVEQLRTTLSVCGTFKVRKAPHDLERRPWC